MRQKNIKPKTKIRKVAGPATATVAESKALSPSENCKIAKTYSTVPPSAKLSSPKTLSKKAVLITNCKTVKINLKLESTALIALFIDFYLIVRVTLSYFYVSIKAPAFLFLLR